MQRVCDRHVRLPWRLGARAGIILVVGALSWYAPSMLVPADANAAQRTLRISGMRSAPSDGASFVSAPSRDGRFVAFQSLATNLASGGSLSSNVYVRDSRGASIRRVSKGIAGAAADGFSGAPSMDASGRFIAYATAASNVVERDGNDSYDVVMWDGFTNTQRCVSVTPAGFPASGDSFAPAVSSSGRFVAFVSRATDIAGGDSGGIADIFLRDMDSGTTIRLSRSSDGGDANGDSGAPSISADGRRVAFSSSASNLVPGDTNGQPDVFLYDASTSTLSRVNVTAGGGVPRVGAIGPCISGDGRRVAFESISDQLVKGDRNGVRDIFVRDIAGRYT
ncbi:MAG: hypothetical protein FDZ75_08165, partial [Actinobacteria bacterium]